MSKKRAITPLNYSKFCSAMFNHDLDKFNQQIFLILLDKIMARSYHDVSRIFFYQDLGKITHVLSRLSRSCMSWQGVSSCVSLEKALFENFCPRVPTLDKTSKTYKNLYDAVEKLNKFLSTA